MRKTILLILGVVILVILILGFTLGWNKVLPFFSTNNVQNIQTSCSSACATNNAYEYCVLNRTLQAPDLPGGAKKAYGNCTWFSTIPDYKAYGIESCSQIDCSTVAQTQ